MKLLMILIGLLLPMVSFTQTAHRELKTVTFSGSGRQLGLQHGKVLKKEIGEIISAWKDNTTTQLGKDADIFLSEFFEYADFTDAIKKWTPELYEEVKGIADGSEQQFNDVFVLNLLDEFWVYIDNLNNHHCSGAGIPSRNGKPGYISQNMDLEDFTDGFQVLMRLQRTDAHPEQLILTYPGLVALNGLNEEGIGVCVNTLMQLKASSDGLPVAFVIRRILASTDKDDVLSFVQQSKHASGQNYLIGIKGEIYDFEASANKVVRFDPMNSNGSVYHTNHPIVNDDIKPQYEKYSPSSLDADKPVTTNSHMRFNAVERRLTSDSDIDDQNLKDALRSRDDKMNPVCRSNNGKGYGFTFASTIMTLSDDPNIQIATGPPDESNYIRYDFTPKE